MFAVCWSIVPCVCVWKVISCTLLGGYCIRRVCVCIYLCVCVYWFDRYVGTLRCDDTHRQASAIPTLRRLCASRERVLRGKTRGGGEKQIPGKIEIYSSSIEMRWVYSELSLTLQTNLQSEFHRIYLKLRARGFSSFAPLSLSHYISICSSLL